MQKSSRTPTPKQPPAEVVRDLEARFLSTLFRGLPDSYDRAVASGVDDAELFAYSEHGFVFRALMTIALDGRGPDVEIVRGVLAEAFGDHHFRHWKGDAGAWDELRELLECECSAAGLENYGRLIVRFHRKHLRLRRLWKVLVDHADDRAAELYRLAQRVEPDQLETLIRQAQRFAHDETRKDRDPSAKSVRSHRMTKRRRRVALCLS